MIGITLGDPGGIGIEVTLKAIRDSGNSFVLFGSRKAVEYYSKKLDLEIPANCSFENISGDFHVGEVNSSNGEISFKSIIRGVDALKEGRCSALVTAPVNKKALSKSGHQWPGHTELLASELGDEKVVMLMRSDVMNVIFITTHIPLKEVSSKLSKNLIIEKVELASRELKKYWDYESLHFGILGLNPHAGDGGLFGDEESKIIKPAVSELKNRGINIGGPYSADTYWREHKKDCTVALYHDQGMIPFKMASYGKGVNVTLGLSKPRTSPDHGTAFDIAGRGMADPGSMERAIETAVWMSNV